MNSTDHRYKKSVAVSVAAILLFVLTLELFGESEYSALAISAALFFWLIAMFVMVFNVPRYLIHLARDRFGLIGKPKPDEMNARSRSK